MMTPNDMFRRLLEMVRIGKYDGSKESELYGPIEKWDVSQVTDMSYAFADCNVHGNAHTTRWSPAFLEKLNLGAWDTSNVRNMKAMFHGATSFRGDGIGAWNTGNVIYMTGMFKGATSFQGSGIGAWNTGKVTIMRHMFREATSFRGDGIGAWNTGKVTDMSCMFCNATNFRGDGIGAWDIRNVTHMSCMFYGATNFRGKGIGDWVISPKLTNTRCMFAYTEQFNEPIRWTQPQGANPLSPPASPLAPPTTNVEPNMRARALTLNTQGMFYKATAFEFHETLPPRGAAQDDAALHNAVYIDSWG